LNLSLPQLDVISKYCLGSSGETSVSKRAWRDRAA
jgi:hypothetical protein